MRAKEASAQNAERSEESVFLSTFRSVPRQNSERLAELAGEIVGNFNNLMDETRHRPFERQEEVMAGMKRLFIEQINVIEARRAYAVKLNPSTVSRESA
jgi:hypothetical protein